MRYLFHISSLYGGGAERVMANLINYFSETGNNIKVVVCYEHDNEYSINSNVEKVVIGKSNLLKQSRLLKKEIKKFKPDLCISFMQGGNFRMVLANLFSKQKYILSVRNDPKKEYPNFFSRLFAKKMFCKANGIVFQTPDAQSFFSKKIARKSVIIFNPISNEFYTNFREEKTRDIISLGRLTEQKNFDLLIDSYNFIKDEVDDNLLIYGDGDLKEHLQNKINNLKLNDRVFLMGRTNDSKEVLKNAKCFVMSSDFEGMPNALLEAVCMLVPSISTDCPCGGSKIALDGNGILVPIQNRKALADAMLRLLTSFDLQKELSEKCLEKRKMFDTNAILKQWDLYFKKILM